MVGRFSMLLLAVYLVLVVFLWVWQRQMIYLPDTRAPSAIQLASAGLVAWPTGAEEPRALVALSAPKQVKATVLVFHGNAGAAWNREYYIRALQSLGYRVLLVEYPGYGGRKGSPSEQVLVEDALQTLQLVHKQFGGPIFLWGESLGAGVAAAVIGSTDVPVDGLVMVAPWDSLAELAQTHYPLFPARWLVRDRYDSIHNLKNFRGRVAILTAEQDRIIPNHHSLRLFESLAVTKKQWAFANSNHNRWPNAPGERWWRDVMTFVRGE